MKSLGAVPDDHPRREAGVNRAYATTLDEVFVVIRILFLGLVFSRIASIRGPRYLEIH